jgi:asparagine synthetase B (glutamine-hydrolysing)
MKLAGSQPRLICVGTHDSTDALAAEKAADALGLPLSIKTFTEDDLEEHLGVILASVEEADPMKVGSRGATILLSHERHSWPCRAILTGNGAMSSSVDTPSTSTSTRNAVKA